MIQAIVHIAYMVAAVLFITGLQRLSRVRSARQGNTISGIGMTIAILAYAFWGQMTPDIVAAIALFALGLVFSSLADGFSAVFNAYEKMEYPAAISTVTTMTRVSLGALVLLLGWGFVGLAGVSIAANIVSAAALAAGHGPTPQSTATATTARIQLSLPRGRGARACQAGCRTISAPITMSTARINKL